MISRPMAHAAIIAVVATCIPSVAMAQSNGLFGQMLGKIIGPQRGKVFGLAAPSGLAPITQAQADAIKLSVVKSTPSGPWGGDWRAASPLITKIISIASCANGDSAWNAVNREAVTPGAVYSGGGFDRWYRPMDKSQYHNKNYCLDVLRIGSITKPAANAINFSVFYISSQSQESNVQNYELQRAPEGQWLVRSVSMSN